MRDGLNIKEKTISGVRWSGLYRGVQSGFTFLETIILARLLQPEDYGLFGMATVFTSLVAMFNEVGGGSALIQKKDLEEKEISSIFWFILLIGVFLMIMTFVLASPISIFFNEPRLVPILKTLAPSFFLLSLSTVQRSIIVRNLDFKSFSIVRINSTVISGLLAIALAYFGYGVWSLVFQSLFSAFLTTLFFWFKGKWRPLFHFNWKEVSPIMNFNVNYFSSNLVRYFSEKTPNLLIGKYLGPEPLGFYTLASRLVTFPLETISYSTRNVLFPLFSRIQEDNERIRELCLQSIKHISFIGFPLMAGLFITSPLFISSVFGPKWNSAVFILQIVVIVGIIKIISMNNDVLYLSKGRTDYQFQIGLVSAILMTFAIYAGTGWGLKGVVISQAAVSLLLAYPSLVIPNRLIGLKTYRLFLTLKETVLVTIIMSISLSLVIFLIESNSATPLITLILSVLAGAIVYILCSMVVNRGIMASFYEMINIRT